MVEMSLTPALTSCPACLRCVWLSFASLLCAVHLPVSAEVRVERGYLLNAKPNAFAVSLDHGVSVCFDPIRGGLNTVWKGGFLDVAPIRPGMGKAVRPAALLGAVVYQESGEFPLRVGDPSRRPEVRFVGYNLGADHIEFIYRVGAVEIREEIRSFPDGSGLVRRLRLESGSPPVWYFPGERSGATISIRNARPVEGGWQLTPDASGEVVIELRFEEAPR